MKTLHLILCALVTGTVTEAAERGPQPRDVEIITPLTTNLFARPTNALTGRTIDGRQTIRVGPATNRFGSPVNPGRSTNLNTVALTNTGFGTPTSGLIGPVFPARNTNVTATGGTIGSDGLVTGGGFGTNSATGVALTNALPPGFGENVGRLPDATVPGPSVPQPGGTPPLAPPTPIAPPAPGVPGSVPPGGVPGNIPNAAPRVPGSAAPTPVPGAPLAPPSGPALPPTAPAAPPAAPGGAPGGTGAGTR
jgi:hypothetical protein